MMPWNPHFRRDFSASSCRVPILSMPVCTSCRYVQLCRAVAACAPSCHTLSNTITIKPVDLLNCDMSIMRAASMPVCLMNHAGEAGNFIQSQCIYIMRLILLLLMLLDGHHASELSIASYSSKARSILSCWMCIIRTDDAAPPSHIIRASAMRVASRSLNACTKYCHHSDTDPGLMVYYCLWHRMYPIHSSSRWT